MLKMLTAVLLIFSFAFADANYDKAKDLFDKSVNTDSPELKTELRKEILRVSPETDLGYFAKAYLVGLEKTGGPEEIILFYSKALELNPKFDYAFLNRGMEHEGLGKDDKALNDYNMALEISPKKPLFYYTRGNFYNSRSLTDKSLKDFSRAVELDPNYSDAYNGLGVVYAKSEQKEKAIEAFEKAADLGNTEAVNNLEKLGIYYASIVNTNLRNSNEKNIEEPAKQSKETLSLAVSDSLRSYLFKSNKFVMIERTKMQEILKEQVFQMTGCTKTECAVEVGKLLNVKYIIVGSLSKLSEEYVFNIRVVDVESSELIDAEIEKCKTEAGLSGLLEKISKNITKSVAKKSVKINIAVLEIEVK